MRQMKGILPLFPAGCNGGPTTSQLSSLSSPALLNARSTAAEAVAAAAGGGKAGRPTATTMEAEAAAGAAGGAAKGGSPGGRKGPVIKRAPSRASQSSLASKGFFGGQLRRPLKFTVTGLPPTVRPFAAESPAVEESIEEGGGGASASKINKYGVNNVGEVGVWFA